MNSLHVQTKLEVTSTLLKPLDAVINLLFHYYDQIETSISNAKKLIEDSDKLKLDSEAYHKAKSDLTTAIKNHQDLNTELQNFQTQHLSLVHEGRFDL